MIGLKLTARVKKHGRNFFGFIVRSSTESDSNLCQDSAVAAAAATAAADSVHERAEGAVFPEAVSES